MSFDYTQFFIAEIFSSILFGDRVSFIIEFICAGIKNLVVVNPVTDKCNCGKAYYSNKNIYNYIFCKKIKFHNSSNSYLTVFCYKFITDSPYSFYCPVLVVFDFLTDTLYMDIYGTSITKVFISPNMVEKLFSCKYLIRR